MSNLDKVFERNRITKQGIDAMITNYLKLERKLAEAQAEITRLKGEAESWEKVFDRTCEHLADAKEQLREGMTLRDYFAAKAMQGMLANPKLQEQILKAGQSWIEKSAWSVADAMLKERNNE